LSFDLGGANPQSIACKVATERNTVLDKKLRQGREHG